MASRRSPRAEQIGFSYVEVLAALVLTAMLLVVLTRVVGNVLEAQESSRATHDALEDSRYALQRMVRAVSRSGRLLIPQAENPATVYSESNRDPGVLAVMLDPARDLDGDGVPDADNDGDGRIDEDLDDDANNDGKAGVRGIDDDNDGDIDNGGNGNNDESGASNDDSIDGIDTDGDGAVDEDPDKDMNLDGEPGIAGVDDDGDGFTDEGSVEDDDEDDSNNEDWWDVVAFYQTGSTLIERIPVPWDEDGGGVSGEDFVERTLATNVTEFRVGRVPAPNGGPPLVELALTLANPGGAPYTLTTTVRVGGGL